MKGELTVVELDRDQAGLETYFFSHSQTFASGFNLNSQIAVSNSQLVFPTFEQFLTLRGGMAIVSWGWNLVHRSPLLWKRTCWRPHSSFLRLKKYIIFSAIALLQSHGKTASLCYEALRLFHCFYCRLAETSLRPRSGFGIRWNIELATFFECLYFQLAKLNFNSHFASLQAWISSPVRWWYELQKYFIFILYTTWQNFWILVKMHED